MDLSHSEADEEFRTRLRGWLAENVPDPVRDADLWSRAHDGDSFETRREWEAGKAAAGWAGVSWPTEYGGLAGTPAQKAIYDEELARARAPRSVNGIGLVYFAPALMRYGTDEQKRRFLGPLLRNEVIWCQGFSEPGAGSDLAALSTRAERDGDHFVVNGQKVWTTNATHGDWMFTLVRTSSGEKKQQGITMLLIDMHSPGVEVRPIRQMSGERGFGEVFLTDVRVPAENVVGEVDRGWEVAMTLLSFERGSSAIGQYTEYRHELDRIIALAHRVERDGRPAAQDPALRQQLAQSLVDLELLRLHSLHVLTKTERGEDLGFEASMTKLLWSETHQDLYEAYTDVLGGAHQLADPLPELDVETERTQFLWTRSETIWGGSSQVQRNVVAERVLGLPR